MDEEDLETRVRQRFEHLKRCGKQVSGISDRDGNDTLPKWIDRQKFNKCRQTIQNNIVR